MSSNNWKKVENEAGYPLFTEYDDTFSAKLVNGMSHIL